MANKYPLVFSDNKIKELPSGDNLNMLGSSIVDVVNITATGTITADTLTVNTLNASGGGIASVAISGDYNDLINKPNVFSGSFNDLVNVPVIFSGNYNDLSNKPNIPSRTSQLINDAGFVSNVTATIPVANVDGIAAVAITNDFEDLDNVPDFITRTEIAGGTLTVEVKNTGDLVGSVFGSDSTLLVDHLNSSIPASVISGVGNFNLSVNTGTTTLNNLNVSDFSAVRSSLSILTAGEVSLEGHLVAEDSSILIDSVTKKHYGTFDGNITKTSSVNPLTISAANGVQISPNGVLNVPNATSVSIAGTSYIDILATDNLTLSSSSGKVIIMSSTVPTSSLGASGDKQGMVAFDSTSIYYCVEDFTTGDINIWVKQDWGDTLAW